MEQPASTVRHEAEVGRRRLALDELVVLQLALRRRADERASLVSEALPPPGDDAALAEQAQTLLKSGYGQYLLDLLQRR